MLNDTNDMGIPEKAETNMLIGEAVMRTGIVPDAFEALYFADGMDTIYFPSFTTQPGVVLLQTTEMPVWVCVSGLRERIAPYVYYSILLLQQDQAFHKDQQIFQQTQEISQLEAPIRFYGAAEPSEGFTRQGRSLLSSSVSIKCACHTGHYGDIGVV